jgi:mono/diheme cytochrome c family protein
MSVVLGHQAQTSRAAPPPHGGGELRRSPAPPTPPTVVHHADRGLPWFPKAVLFAAPVLVTVLGWGTAATVFFNGVLTRESTPATTAAEPDGGRLYVLNCANCHGERGEGRGTTLLTTPARHFGFDRFKLVTTQKNSRGFAIPSDADLFRVIRRGIPGSAMPEFPRLSDEEVAAIIGHVRVLIRNGTYERLYQKAKKEAEDEGGEVNVGEVRRKVDAFVEVGSPLDIPKAFAQTSAESVARGRQVFVREACVKCHGPEGRGNGEQTQDPKFQNDDGTPARPRDLTLGLYKGGGEKEHLYARIMLSIPGTPMPEASGTLRGRDVEDLLNYIQSLVVSPVGAGQSAIVAPPSK